MSYFKPNSKQAIKLAIAVKSISGTVGASTWLSGHDKYAIAIFIAGALANEAINFLSDDTKKEDAQKP